MLEDRRVKAAERSVKDYLAEGLLRKHALFRKEIFSVLIDNAHESIKIADFISERKESDLWVVVTSYYSMFYAANAVLYKLGYKVGDKIPHKVTADALIVLVRGRLKDALLEDYENAQCEALAGMKADALLEDFDSERRKRNVIQYETGEREKHSKALTSLRRAKEFLFEMEKLMAGPE